MSDELKPGYFIELSAHGCMTCKAGRLWDVIGPDGVGTGTSYSDEGEAQDMADELSHAYRLGLYAAHPIAADAQNAGREDGLLQCLSERIQEANGEGFWQPCSGCYDSEDGHPRGPYPYSGYLNCHIGSGCPECGGLGAIWHYIDPVALAESHADIDPPASAPSASGAVPRELLANALKMIMQPESKRDHSEAILLCEELEHYLAAAPGGGRLAEEFARYFTSGNKAGIEKAWIPYSLAMQIIAALSGSGRAR
jgi:hypothetical protein